MTNEPGADPGSGRNRQSIRRTYPMLPLWIEGAIVAMVIGIPVAFSASGPGGVADTFGMSLSRPAGTTVLSPNPTPSLGQVGAYYFETGNQSQIWMNLEPQSLEPGPNAIRLNVTVAFPGRSLDRAPDTVDVRVESVDTAYPMTIRRPTLRFQLAGGIQMDLTAPGRTFQFISGCLDCTMDTVIIHLGLDALRQVAGSSTVGIEALGFSARLKPADLLSLRKFIDVVSNGVRIR